MEEAAIIASWPCPATTLRWKQWPDQFPLRVRQIPAIHDCSSKSSLESEVAAFGNPFCQHRLDRDLAAYRSWFDAGLIAAGVIITKDRLSLLNLARRLWLDHQQTLDEDARNPRLPIDLSTSTVTAFDKAEMRVRRGVMGACPVLIVAANESTWNGQPFTIV
ncbi:MAG: hypothetical protein KJ904_04645 [Alphaproteobacteria bacterium]|nr:hypothetical protein [Alphaproteobacteria bacterium]